MSSRSYTTLLSIDGNHWKYSSKLFFEKKSDLTKRVINFSHAENESLHVVNHYNVYNSKTFKNIVEVVRSSNFSILFSKNQTKSQTNYEIKPRKILQSTKVNCELKKEKLVRFLVTVLHHTFGCYFNQKPNNCSVSWE